MPQMKCFRRAILACLLAVLPGAAQTGLGTTPRGPWTDPLGHAGQGDNPLQDEKLLEALNADRQKALIKDTGRLLNLVTELNADIARTSPEALSPDQLRRMAEIEKLARSVREKMSMSVRGTPPFMPPPVHIP
jgi:hypothetical protein